MNPIASNVLAWLLTYLIHSTVLLGVAWLVTRRWRLEPAATELLWKVALLAPLVTGTIQSRLELSTPAAVRLPPPVATAPQGPQLTEPATPATEAPLTPDSRPGSVNQTLPSLPLVLVLLWGVVALGSSLYYVARRLILIGRLADRRPVSDGPLAATLADLQRTAGYRRRVRLTMARTISSPVALGQLTDHRVLHFLLGHRGAVVVLARLGGGPPSDDPAALEARQHGGDGGLGQPALGVQGLPDVLDRRFALVPDDAQDGELQLGELMALRHTRPRG